MSKAGQKIIKGLKQTTARDPELVRFQAESNRIEGINRVRSAEVEALAALLARPILLIDDLVDYVAVCQPDARLRDHRSVPGVRVGKHVAPPSGEELMKDLRILLSRANRFGAPFGTPITPWEAHCLYENLHPFTDGNGRSGRALWLWMHGRAPLGFLHTWYYETLEQSR